MKFLIEYFKDLKFNESSLTKLAILYDSYNAVSIQKRRLEILPSFVFSNFALSSIEISVASYRVIVLFVFL